MLIFVFLFLLGIIAVLVLYLAYAVSRLGRKLDDTLRITWVDERKE